jgi:uncharacterized membrane protein SirB2
MENPVNMISWLVAYYPYIKIVHISCALLTLCSFSIRGYWMLIESPLLEAKLTKILPHLIDSVLLLSAVLLTLILHQYPFANSWLTAKLFGLIIYILLGAIALKRGKNLQQRLSAFIVALTCIGYIFGVALSKSPMSWLAFWS